MPLNPSRIALALAWTGLALAAACALAELAGGPGYRMGWWTYGSGIQVVRWAATAGILAAALALVAVVIASRHGVRDARFLGALGLALSLLVIGPPVYLLWVVGQVPYIHDISTDTADPPRFVAIVPLRQGSPNTTETSAQDVALQKKGYPDIAPAILAEPPEKAFQRAERAARAMGWEIVAVVAQERRIEATDTTLLFGFKDDVVIRVAADGKGSRVDMRSLSRVGLSDLGVNAKRIRAFMKALAGA